MTPKILPNKAVEDLLELQRIIIGLSYKDAYTLFLNNYDVIRKEDDSFDVNFKSLCVTIEKTCVLGCTLTGNVEYYEY